MKLIKASALTTVLVASLISTNIPTAISAPSDSKPTTTDRSKQPRIPSSTILNVDGNPNGAQVRVLFKLSEGEKLVCSDVNVTVTTREPDAPNNNNDPNQIVLTGNGRIVNQYKGKMFASTSNPTTTCLYNFSLKQEDIKKNAYISIGGTYVNANPFLVYSGPGSSEFYAIKNIKQTFRINGGIASTQVN
jgi:hypothetical protein